MVELNSNQEKTVWWHTVLHVILFPVFFISIVLISGLVLYALGRFDNVFAFIVRAFQYGISAHFALIIPTFFLRKSNEVVTSTIVATVGAILIAIIDITAFSVGTNEKYTLFQWFEIAASQIGFMFGVIIYYFGER